MRPSHLHELDLTKHNFTKQTRSYETLLYDHSQNVKQASALSAQLASGKTDVGTQIQYKVEGEVQGVNFRSFTQKQAKSIGVTGFVTNASDGSVRTCIGLISCHRSHKTGPGRGSGQRGQDQRVCPAFEQGTIGSICLKS